MSDRSAAQHALADRRSAAPGLCTNRVPQKLVIWARMLQKMSFYGHLVGI
jgi:hypothetical protein